MASILVLYHSQMYGNTHKMALAVAEGIRAAGSEAVLVNTNTARLDMEQYRGYDAVAFGSPDYFSYFAGGLKVFLDDWYIACQKNDLGLKGKPLALFHTHGGGGGARAPFEKFFRQLGNQLGDMVVCKGTPDADTLAKCKDLGRQLAEKVRL